MLASRPVRAAGERVVALGPAAAAASACFCALFFGGGPADAPLVWIGGLTLVLAATGAAAVLVGVLPAPRLDGPAAALAVCLLGLAVWAGLTTLWSTSPDRSWGYTNRTLVYAGFALLGLLAGTIVPRERLAEAAALLLALVFGWALLAKCVPGLYSDYGRIARLRSPLGYWNELALLCDAGVALALWLAAARRRAVGVVLLYALVVTLLLTYSRFGVALACVAAAVWVVLDRSRVESLAAIGLGGGIGAAVFGIAFTLHGVTDDGQPRSVRAHDGWIFALVVLAGAAVAYVAARATLRHPVAPERRVRVERVAGLTALALAVAGLAVSIAFAGRIWKEFTNPAQVGQAKTRLTSASSPRWTWWQEAWQAFTHHPFGGTGAGTFELTNQMLRRSPVVVDEPHNTPLQFLSETGIVGFLLYLGAAGALVWGVVRGAGDAAALALGIGATAFFAHSVVDKDWNYVGTCGPLLLLAGALLARQGTRQSRRRPLLAVAAIAVSLAAVYSVAAPWLAQRQLASATNAADAKRARSYDPLSVDAIELQAAFEDAAGHPLRAEALYRKAVSLEPENTETWYALGEFYFSYKAWQLAYEALNNAYTYDRFGDAAKPCGLLDQARTRATGYTPPKVKLSCRELRRSSSP
jgi:hypothetical protein